MSLEVFKEYDVCYDVNNDAESVYDDLQNHDQVHQPRNEVYIN